MFEYFRYCVDLIRKQLAAVLNTDLSGVEFANSRWAIGAAGVLALVFLLKLFYWLRYGRKKTARQSSGHPAIRQYSHPLWKRLVHGAPRVLLAFASAFLLVALGRPYITNYYDVSRVKSTEICYLEDASGSMTERFGGLEKSKAEIAREALLEFLKLRKGKHDRACFWLFSSSAFKIEDFTYDERSFMFQVYSAPWIFDFGSYSYIPPERLIQRRGEGGTDMEDALIAQAKYFDREGTPEVPGASGRTVLPRRVLVIITDAEVDQYPDQGFKDLKNARIVPYLIYLRNVPMASADEESPSSAGLSSVAQKFVNGIAEHGGKSFIIGNDAATRQALREAFREIDRIEKVESLKKQYAERVEIFQLPLAIGIALLTLSAFLGSIMAPAGRNP